MRKLILFLICLLFCSSAFGVELIVTKEYEQDLIRRVQNIYTNKEPIYPLPKCGTPTILELNMVKDKLSPEALKLLKPYLARPSLQKTYDTPGGQFKIHYDTSGSNAVYHWWEDVDPFDSIPDYVNRCAEIFDYVWLKEIDTLGYKQPPSDVSMGGDSRYDIYIKNLGWGYLGVTTSESSTNPYWSYTSYIEIAHDFSIYGYPDQYDLMAVTAGHEFFHSIQMGYDLFEGCDPYPNWRPYWMEMSSVWMEEQTFDEVNDYLIYLPYFFDYPWWSLKTFSSNFYLDQAYHPYGSCVFPMYLSEKYGVDIMRQIWERCGQSPDSDVWPAIASITGDLAGEFREFTVWNFFTGDRADTANYYSEGNLWYDGLTPIQIDSVPALYHDSYPVEADSIPEGYQPGGLASDYIFFETKPNISDSIGGLRVEFYGYSRNNWKGSIIGYSDTLALIYDVLMSPEKQDGVGQVINWGKFDHIVLVPARLDGDTIGSDFRYCAFYDSTLTSEPTSPDMIKVFQSAPNPFMIEEGESFVSFPMIVKEATYVEINIFTVAGELVRKVYRGNLPAGDYSRRDAYPGLIPALAWDGKNEQGEDIASGIYLYQIKTKDMEVIKKMAVIRK